MHSDLRKLTIPDRIDSGGMFCCLLRRPERSPMFEFSACVDLILAETDRSIPGRIRAAADDGFPAVEFWLWRDKNVAGVQDASTRLG